MPASHLTASSRIEAAALLGQLQTVRATIEAAVARSGGGSADSRLTVNLSAVAGAETTLSQALQSGGSLAHIDLGALARLVQGSQITLTTFEAAHATDTAAAAAVADLAAASAATRQEVQTLSQDLFTRRIFEPYLRFASADDEAAYRAREAERQRLIAEDLAKHTPEGDLRAAIHEAGQMADAGSHGANASPDFGPRWRQLVDTIHRHREAMQAAHQSTEKEDELLRSELRRSLQRLPAEQLERILSAKDPLDAATPYLTTAQATRLEKQLQPQQPGSTPADTTRAASAVDQASLAAAASALQAGTDLSAAGLTLTGLQPSAEQGHGLRAQASAGSRGAAATPS